MNPFERILMEFSQFKRKIDLMHDVLITIFQQVHNSEQEKYICPHCKTPIYDNETTHTRIEHISGVPVRVQYLECKSCKNKLKTKRVIDAQYRPKNVT